jgi:hypothetical protein
MKIKLQKLPGHTWELECQELAGEENLPQDYVGLGYPGSERSRLAETIKQEVHAVFGRVHVFMQTSCPGYAAWEFLGEGDESKILEASERIAHKLGVELEI